MAEMLGNSVAGEQQGESSTEKQQFPHFSAWLLQHAKARRPQSAQLAKAAAKITTVRSGSAGLIKRVPATQTAARRPHSAAAKSITTSSTSGKRSSSAAGSTSRLASYNGGSLRQPGGLLSSSVPRPFSASSAVLSAAQQAVTITNPWTSFGGDVPPSWLQMADGTQVADAAAKATSSLQQAVVLADSKQHHSQRAARQLFQQLPFSSGSTSMSRQELQLLALGLQCACSRVGAPIELQTPQQLGCEKWSATAQLTPEVEVWDKLLSEICRQVRIECSERGTLLLSAVTRQKQMLQAALATCDSMFQLSLASREALQQQEEQVQSLQQLLASAEQRQQQLQAVIDAKQGMLDAATSELQHQQDRMRRGRYHVIQQEVAQVRQGLEERMLAELQRRLAHQTLQSAAVSGTSSQRSAHRSISPAASAEEHTDSNTSDVA